MPDLRRSAGKTLLPRKRQCAVRLALGAKDSRQCGDRQGKEKSDSNRSTESEKRVNEGYLAGQREWLHVSKSYLSMQHSGDVVDLR